MLPSSRKSVTIAESHVTIPKKVTHGNIVSKITFLFINKARKYLALFLFYKK